MISYLRDWTDRGIQQDPRKLLTMVVIAIGAIIFALVMAGKAEHRDCVERRGAYADFCGKCP